MRTATVGFVPELRDWGIVIPGHSDRGALSKRCGRLLVHAAELAEQRTPRAVVFTGWSIDGGCSEAEQMLDQWPGRRDVDLVVEATARTTAQNASRSLPLLLARGIREATIVCAPLHAHRVRYFFGRLYEDSGLRCEISPARMPPTPFAAAWELAALAVMRRQLRSALAELEISRG
jgi:uncharacterized SAM-binding protein YcdF (DUF218 family)